ncbi:MAG: SUMF1/EgtB/PvdO family nonheme iron enzyme, partial [Verrucomicrobiota bacterium]|nr:SUMF1/EgtB/PvdO family nonheme iron enzyme [Verrucomicrobiota bacterium]
YWENSTNPDNSTDPDNPWYEGKGTHQVGTKAANELGIHDLSGNVEEWCWDWYESEEWCWDWYGSYSSGPVTDPRGPVSGFVRVRRGGSWGSFASHCRVANRSFGSPDISGSLRLARTVPGR